MLADCDRAMSVKYIDKAPEVKQTHYEKHLYPFLTEIIKSVVDEQESIIKDGEHVTFQDAIDYRVNKDNYESQYKDGFNEGCGEKYIPKTKLNCPACKRNGQESKLQYLGIADNSTHETRIVHKCENGTGPTKTVRVQFQEKSQHSTILPENRSEASSFGPYCGVCKPIFVNPCSYDSSSTVLRNIGQTAGVKKYGSEDDNGLVTFVTGHHMFCVYV